MNFLTDLAARPPARVVFAPSDRFFMRIVPLAPDSPVAAQVELALETLAPFPPAQLYWGYSVAPDRTRALVYAAHRRRFTPEETAAWEGADLVLPDVLTLVGATASGRMVRVHAIANRLLGVAWSDDPGWPAAVQARTCATEPDDVARGQFAAELAARAGVAGAAVRSVTGAVRARQEKDGLYLEIVEAAGRIASAAVMARENMELLDVRDRVFLTRRRQAAKRGNLLWRLLLAGAAAFALAGLAETGSLAFRGLTGMTRAKIATRAPIVQRLETANSLASRIGELTHRRLRFFEMVSAINTPRPPSIRFTRTSSNGRNALDLSAQTNAADDVGNYQVALQELPAVDSVDMGEIRGRDGVTTFELKVTFKSDAPLAGSGGAP